MAEDLVKASLDYHEADPPGKIAIQATKPVANQADLSLAYSPGVAHACTAIAEDPSAASRFTARGNLVAVISNGTAVLGLGDIGPLASKPVMEGKGVLFKKFAGIDVFDIEVAETDPKKFVEAIAPLEPTFGGINLEDIKAPECFEIEARLRERMNIPVFHDDQHGTAIVVASGIVNGLKVVGKRIEEAKFAVSGAGAAALACLNLLCALGLKRENITISDIKGVVYKGRSELMDPFKESFARDTSARTLAEIMAGADVFLGLSAGGIVSRDMVATMADRPIVFALANPDPEILPEDVKAVRPDAVIASGRTDYANQINNVLCFPFIFRGALDVGAREINEDMKKAAVLALAGIAETPPSDVVRSAYGGEQFMFGPDYIIPKPFDPRLSLEIPPAVAKAAMDSGVATRPIEDFDVYNERLARFVFKSGFLMKPVFDGAKAACADKPRKLIFAEGEHTNVLQAIEQVVMQGLARPVLVGRRDTIVKNANGLGLGVVPDEDFEIFDPGADPKIPELMDEYYRLVERRGISLNHARRIVRAGATVAGALLLRRGDADAMICGVVGRYQTQLRHVEQIVGRRNDVHVVAALSGLILPEGPLFMTDTFVNYDPTDEHLAEITILAAEEVKRLGIEPKVALLSHSNFGSENTQSAKKMREVRSLLVDRAPGLVVEGEMQADAALWPKIRCEIFPNSSFQDPANLLVLPDLDAANIAFTLLRGATRSVQIGPILLGAAKPVHIVTPSITVRGLLNMSAIAITDAIQAEA